jgi:CRISPR-associated protein Cmr4
MANLISKGFVLNFLTNLHAGSGDANYGIIDKLVQREPATGRPIIHSSSFKGALREYFEQPKMYPFDEVKKITNPFISEIFGSHQKDEKNMETGKCRFLAAYLLALPVRSNIIPYFMATSVDVLMELKQEAESTGYRLSPPLLSEINAIIDLFKVNEVEAIHKGGPFIFTNSFGHNITLEDWKATVKTSIKVTELEKITGNNLAVFNASDFADLCNQLPVIARNQLENGISKNLWYEEVVPRFSHFFQFTLIPDEKNPTIDSFVKDLLNNENTFQIGANATIGYGYCKFNTL